MYHLILVMAGGALGSAARLLVGRATLAGFGPNFPYGTLTVNLVGGLAMGVLAGILARHPNSEAWRLLLGVGVLGGFTTFSSFSLDTIALIERGSIGTALGYVLVSVIGSILAVFVGLTAVRVAA
ncbi:MAG: fluoride efflux transporter CrcB [Sphingomonas sp.]|jgi:CrcB protein|uniref:fluoride efflux transporter CrcB n=1 Tax=unclassified Sphingomonas TaxID=196159 RepID=UPI00053D1C21|nr:MULTISPECIES: fluoride efflux transporter CrcB [unclassified Sphingomonas]MDR6848509.1 CrcB protein [Sphingomonas sp. BE137]MDR7260142.1 CrcB protein [Sphingomonas sp. BE270]RUN75547.1 fluoride efflux transporter CrcB [Sphingomonas sp. TF3]